MQVTGKVVVVTGGANGIGRALCEAFHRAGAAKVVVADLDSAGAEAVAASIGGAAFKCDVGQEKDIRHLIEETERRFGPIALFCSNAGIGGGFDPLSENAGGTSDEPWAKSWAIHVMAHVYAARHLIPLMKARGGGYFLNTISAAGLLSQVGSPAYSTTKHAAVGFAENLAISHRAHGIKISILCPQGVDTNMLRSIPKGPQSGDGDLSPEQVAQDALKGIEQETFVILPHPQVLDYMRKKTENYDRWIGGMAKIQAKMREIRRRHCERSEAIQKPRTKTGLLRRYAPRNDDQSFCP
jgi:NAD(P)-dependent dehydrogenase (short-subunit alcohol dehydrogenase family)